MKVYFTASLSAKARLINNYEMIVEYLKKNNHKVIFEQIKNETEETIRNMDRKTRIEFLTKVEGWVKSSDFVIAETSHPSVSVGFEVALALRYAKPVLVLYSTGDPPSLLLHHSYDRLHTEKYTPSTVGRIIDDFILYIEGKHDTRFTFFLPEELNAYLEDASRRKKLTKSMYLRRLIEKDFTQNDR